MIRYLKTYAGVLAVMLALDALWLGRAREAEDDVLAREVPRVAAPHVLHADRTQRLFRADHGAAG